MGVETVLVKNHANWLHKRRFEYTKYNHNREVVANANANLGM